MRRALQILVALLCLLPLTFGLTGVFFGAGRLSPTGLSGADLDSQYRFLSACYIALGIIGLWMLPRIEAHTTLFRILCLAVFAGGLARLLSIQDYGLPQTRFLVVMGGELLFPVLIPWQAFVARKMRGRSESPIPDAS